MRELIQIVESALGVTDAWFNTGAFGTQKLADPVAYRVAKESGTLDTLEGPVKYQAGHYIMGPGPKNEYWPLSPENFHSKYDDNQDGTAVPKPIKKIAKLADHDGVVHASWGDLQYTAGQDYIIRHGPNDYGVVKKDIFAKTYSQEHTK